MIARQPKAEWFEEPEVNPKGQTVRFGYGFMPYFSVNDALKFMRSKYKSNFKVLIEYEVFYHVCMTKCKNHSLMEKGSSQP